MTGLPGSSAAKGVARLWASLTAGVMEPLDAVLPVSRERRESGGATVEFVILLPAFLMVFISSFESSLLLVRQVMMERAVDLTVRDIRLDRGSTVSQNEVRNMICRRARILPDCLDHMLVELTPVSQTTYALPATDAPCVNRASTVVPEPDFATSRSGKLILLRACFSVQPMLADSTFAMAQTLAANLVNDQDGAIRMVASSAFVVE